MYGTCNDFTAPPTRNARNPGRGTFARVARSYRSLLSLGRAVPGQQQFRVPPGFRQHAEPDRRQAYRDAGHDDDALVNRPVRGPVEQARDRVGDGTAAPAVRRQGNAAQRSCRPSDHAIGHVAPARPGVRRRARHRRPDGRVWLRRVTHFSFIYRVLFYFAFGRLTVSFVLSLYVARTRGFTETF